MSFENFSINRLAIHEIFARGEDQKLVAPIFSDHLVDLPLEAKSALQARITNALGKLSHGVEMTIRDTGTSSVWHKANEILQSGADDNIFIEISKAVASKLATVQTNRGIPGGIVIVLQGTCGNLSNPVVCAIKAEPHGGFTRRQIGNSLTLEYFSELILTTQTKFYKIGAFVRTQQSSLHQHPSESWRAFLFDENISQGKKQSAAQYFRSAFLGLDFPENSAFMTMRFHDLTKDFIRGANIAAEKKVELLNALTTYLKSDQASTVQASTFSTSYLDSALLQDSYTSFMESQGFPTNSVVKDLTEVATRLKIRKITFGHEIRLTAPSDHFADYVKVEAFDGDPDAAGNVPTWTRITVRDRIRDQE